MRVFGREVVAEMVGQRGRAPGAMSVCAFRALLLAPFFHLIPVAETNGAEHQSCDFDFFAPG